MSEIPPAPPAPPAPPSPPPPSDPRDKQIADLMSRLEAMEKKQTPPADDPDLREKARKEQEAKDKAAGDTKTLERSLLFTMGMTDFVKTNADLLPKDFAGIVSAADKETYGSATEKASAIKSSLIQSFFQQQANLDLLTGSQKSILEDFLKLTKNGKQEKAPDIYDSIFEPTLESAKRVRKAQQLTKDGHVDSSDAEKAYRDRMIKLSRKHYIGDKANA